RRSERSRRQAWGWPGTYRQPTCIPPRDLDAAGTPRRMMPARRTSGPNGTEERKRCRGPCEVRGNVSIAPAPRIGTTRRLTPIETLNIRGLHQTGLDAIAGLRPADLSRFVAGAPLT